MDLVSYLSMSVTPLSEVQISEKDLVETGRRRYSHPVKTGYRNTIACKEARHQYAIERYKKAMGDKWVKTADINNRLGSGRMVAFSTLKTWLDQGILERRPADNDAKFNRRKGWEWRFKP